MDAKAKVVGGAGAATVAAAGVGIGVGIMMRRKHQTSHERGEDALWQVVTVNVAEADIASHERPAPLRRLGDVEIQFRAAPAGRGTEVAVRPGAGANGGKPSHRRRARDIRAALRASKQLWETGEVLAPQKLATRTLSGKEARPSTASSTSSGARPVEYANAQGRQGGRP